MISKLLGLNQVKELILKPTGLLIDVLAISSFNEG